jgi:hypothetical protein
MTLMDILITQKKKDRRSVAQNSGIRIEAFDPLGVKTTYYGYIHDIWEPIMARDCEYPSLNVNGLNTRMV